MGNLSSLKIKNLKEPGRYSDGDGLILDLKAPGRRHWVVRVQYGGKRRDIGLGESNVIGASINFNYGANTKISIFCKNCNNQYNPDGQPSSAAKVQRKINHRKSRFKGANLQENRCLNNG